MPYRQYFTRLINFYNHCLTVWPMTTNATTGFTIAAAGDVVCQYYEQKLDKTRIKSAESIEISAVKYDWIRALEMGVIRAVVIVPFITVWYPFLIYACPGSTIPRIIGRVAIDQSIGSPSVIVLVFVSHACLHGDPWSSIDRIYKQGGNAWAAGLQYWPFIHTINFGLVPLRHQALVAHVASLYWNAILSYYSYKEDQSNDKTTTAIDVSDT
jgi:hypothetical protein